MDARMKADAESPDVRRDQARGRGDGEGGFTEQQREEAARRAKEGLAGLLGMMGQVRTMLVMMLALELAAGHVSLEHVDRHLGDPELLDEIRMVWDMLVSGGSQAGDATRGGPAIVLGPGGEFTTDYDGDGRPAGRG